MTTPGLAAPARGVIVPDRIGALGLREPVPELRWVGIAFVAHALLLAALSLGWQWSKQPLAPADEMVPVEFVDIAEAPRVTEPPKPSIKAAPQETTAPPEPAPTPDTAPPKPDITPPVPTDAVPLPEKKPTPPEKPQPEKAKPEKAKPEKTKVEPKPDAKPLDMSTLSNLIDKALPKAKTKPLDTSSLAKSIAAAQPRNATIDPRAAATLAQAIKSQVAPCWNPPIGGADVRKMTVLIRADFGRDGRLIGVPSVVSQTGVSAGNGDYARAFAETARRAVLRCTPLKLPADMYDLWKSVVINFDPESMT
jgi:outer membrane biosynthesis protein TonB